MKPLVLLSVLLSGCVATGDSLLNDPVFWTGVALLSAPYYYQPPAVRVQTWCQRTGTIVQCW